MKPATTSATVPRPPERRRSGFKMSVIIGRAWKIACTGARMPACARMLRVAAMPIWSARWPVAQCALRHPPTPPRKLRRIEWLHRSRRRECFVRLSPDYPPIMKPKQKRRLLPLECEMKLMVCRTKDHHYVSRKRIGDETILADRLYYRRASIWRNADVRRDEYRGCYSRTGQRRVCFHADGSGDLDQFI